MREESRDLLRLGGVLMTSGFVLWRNLARFLLLGFVGYTPTVALDLIVPREPPAFVGGPVLDDPAVLQPASEPALWLVLLLLLASIVLGALFCATVAYKTVADLRATPSRFGEALEKAWRALPTILGVLGILFLLLSGITFVGAMVWSLIAFVIIGDPATPWAAIMLPMVAIPAFFIIVLVSMVIPVIVVERLGVFAAMRRSVTLTEGRRWRIAWLLLVLIVMIFVANAIPYGLTVLILGMDAVARPMFVLASYAIVTPFVALSWVAIAVIYYDLRTIEGAGARAA